MRIVCHKGFKTAFCESANVDYQDYVFNIPKDSSTEHWTPFTYLKEMTTASRGFPILKKHINGIINCQDKELYASIVATYDCGNFESENLLSSAGIYPFIVQNMSPTEYKNLIIHALFNFKTNQFTHYVFTDKGDDPARILFEGY